MGIWRFDNISEDFDDRQGRVELRHPTMFQAPRPLIYGLHCTMRIGEPLMLNCLSSSGGNSGTSYKTPTKPILDDGVFDVWGLCCS